MKTKHIFWGMLFISIGALILLDNLSLINYNFDYFWKLWPLIFILWGISLMVGNSFFKSVLAIIAAIILAVVLFTGFKSACYFSGDHFIFHNNDGFSFDIDDNYDTTFYSEPYSTNIQKAVLDFNAGAGTFLLDDTTGDLFSAYTSGVKNNYNISRTDMNDQASVKLKMKSRHFSFIHGKIKNKAELKLNTNPIWDMYFNVGAASLDFDLSPYKINNASIEMGAASLNLKLGNKSDSSNVVLKAGASSINILIPDSAGCEIKTEFALSSESFDGFHKTSSNLYQTENFASAKKKIYLEIKAGVSSVKVHRYAGDW